VNAPRRDKRGGTYTLTEDVTVNGVVYTSGTKLISVTTALSSYPKDLVPWAAGEAAKCAMDSLPAMIREARHGYNRPVAIGGREYPTMLHYIRGAAYRRRDSAADLGGAIHDWIEAHILGKPYPVPMPEHEPILEGFRRFLVDWNVEFEATELIVANPADGWAGTLDAYLVPDIMVDWKSGKGDSRKGKCEWPTAGIQQVAYARGTVAWDGQSGARVTPPVEFVKRAMIVHLRPDHHPDTGYGVTTVALDDVHYAQFMRCVETARYMKEHADDVLSMPLEGPLG
jgi:hypothetical protein